MSYFVNKDSIVRQIWGNGDTILMIFAGSAAEFALNKAVDWLYFTGKLPTNPLKRLFSTVGYARQIVFAKEADALKAIDQIAGIHQGVENARGVSIPDWAYRDVLYMLMDYSIRSFELLERSLTNAEKEEVFQVFHRMGTRMGVKDLPNNFQQWLKLRDAALDENLQKGEFTIDLYKQYRKHLGWFRYNLLIQGQTLLVPRKVNLMLGLGSSSFAHLMIAGYKLSRSLQIKDLLKNSILPAAYKKEIIALDARG